MLPTVYSLIFPRILSFKNRMLQSRKIQFFLFGGIGLALWAGVFAASFKVLTYFESIEQLGDILAHKLLSMIFVVILSLLIFRVSDFPKIKEKYGHLAGDHVLRQLAKKVTGHIRREDFLARYGDQEFALILPEIDDNQARVMAEKLQGLVAKAEFVFEEHNIVANITFGLCTSDDAITDPNELLEQAEADLEEK